MTHPDFIERVARAMFRDDVYVTWEAAPESTKDVWRYHAKIAIAAVIEKLAGDGEAADIVVRWWNAGSGEPGVQLVALIAAALEKARADELDVAQKEWDEAEASITDLRDQLAAANTIAKVYLKERAAAIAERDAAREALRKIANANKLAFPVDGQWEARCREWAHIAVSALAAKGTQ